MLLNAAGCCRVTTETMPIRNWMLGLIVAWTAVGQDSAKKFELDAPGNLTEIVTTLRTVGKLQQLEPNAVSGTLTVKGSAAELALAEWLISKLDRATASGAGAQEYRVSGNDVVLAYSLAHTAAPIGMQEIVTTLRTVGDLRYVYLVNSAKVIPMRGTPGQMALAKFIVSELDEAEQARETPVIHTFVSTDSPGTAVVYGLAHTANNTSLQEIITALRSVPQVQRIYNVTGPKLLCFQESVEMAPVVEWLISELDRSEPNTGSNEMRMPGGKDDVMRVFYLANGNSARDLQAMVMTLRKQALIQRVYTNTALPAVIVRGTADQIHLAGQLIAEH